MAGYSLGNGIAHSLSLNTRDLPLLHRDAGVLQDQYSYDANGNVGGIADQQEGVFGRSMRYDGLDRLTATLAPNVWGTASYSYDAADNLRSANVGSRTVTLHYSDGTNRLNSITQNGSPITYGYDPRGNISAKGGQSFAFDLGNRLSSSSLGGGYVYDGHGRRIKVVSSDGSTRLQVYTGDGKLMWSTNVGGGRPTSSTAYVYVGGRLIAEWDSAKGVQYIHTDALGSPVARTNASGGLIGRTRYEPFGLTAAGTRPGPATSIVGFAGHVQDPETDLVYMQQRYYEPVAGRFLSVDPVVTDAGNGALFNRYMYAANNPLTLFDPDGRCTGSHIKNGDGTCKSTGGFTTGTDGARQGMQRERAQTSQASETSRHAAFGEARRAAGVLGSGLPVVTDEHLYDGNRSKPQFLYDKEGKPLLGRVYTYYVDGKVVVIQEHSVGHMQKNSDGRWVMQERGHFNVRDVNGNTLPGTKAHYEFRWRVDPMKYFWRRGGVAMPRGGDQ